MTSPKDRKKSRGFTLIELLVVLAILGLLAAFAVPRVLKYLSSAKTDAAQIQISNISSALDLYRLETGRYPSTAEGIEVLVRKPQGVRGWNGPYLDKLDGIVDPWGRPYRYRFPAEQGMEFDLFSLGADDAEGGEGENADVTNWSADGA